MKIIQKLEITGIETDRKSIPIPSLSDYSKARNNGHRNERFESLVFFTFLYFTTHGKTYYCRSKRSDKLLGVIETKKIHVVCFATGGMTFSNQFIRQVISDQNEAGRLCHTVASKKETGTLFPQGYLTLIPLESVIAPVYGGYTAHDGQYTRDDYLRFINDAFVAEIQYIKSGTMFFDLCDVTICRLGKNSVDFYVNIIKELLETKYAHTDIEFIVKY